MSYMNWIGDSLEFTKECLMGKWVKWIMLSIIPILLPGYLVKICRGESASTGLDPVEDVFVNTIKLFLIGLAYLSIPLILLFIFALGGGLVGAVAGSTGSPDAVIGTLLGAGLLGLLVFCIILLILMLILPIAVIRFSRTDSMREALNFSAIFGHMSKIGWIRYIIALIILFLVVVLATAVVMAILGIISFILAITIIGIILLPVVYLAYLAFFVALTIFVARYYTLIYDSAAA